MNATQYLHFIISSLVTHVHAIEITEEQDELGTLLTLKVDPVDMWSLIGRGWKTIDAVRALLRIFASKFGLRLHLRIREGEE